MEAIVNTVTLVAKNTSEYLVSGVIDFDNVNSLLTQAKQIISDQTDISFNFADVTQSNSAGLALLIELMQQAKALNKTIQFMNLPAKLLAAAKVSDLDKLFPCNQPSSSN